PERSPASSGWTRPVRAALRSRPSGRNWGLSRRKKKRRRDGETKRRVRSDLVNARLAKLRLGLDGPADDNFSWRRGVGLALLSWLATRVVVWSAAYAGAADAVRIRHGIAGNFDLRSPTLRNAVADPASPLGADIRQHLHGFAPLLQWDSGHYQSIITDGY